MTSVERGTDCESAVGTAAARCSDRRADAPAAAPPAAGLSDGTLLLLTDRVGPSPGDSVPPTQWAVAQALRGFGSGRVAQLAVARGRGLLLCLSGDGVNAYTLPGLRLRGQAPRSAGAACFAWDEATERLCVAVKRRQVPAHAAAEGSWPAWGTRAGRNSTVGRHRAAAPLECTAYCPQAAAVPPGWPGTGGGPRGGAARHRRLHVPRAAHRLHGAQQASAPPPHAAAPRSGLWLLHRRGLLPHHATFYPALSLTRCRAALLTPPPLTPPLPPVTAATST